MHTILNAILFRGVFAIKWRAKERFSSNKYGIFHLFSFIRIYTTERHAILKKRSFSYDECAVLRCAIINVLHNFSNKMFHKILYTIRKARCGAQNFIRNSHYFALMLNAYAVGAK